MQRQSTLHCTSSVHDEVEDEDEDGISSCLLMDMNVILYDCLLNMILPSHVLLHEKQFDYMTTAGGKTRIEMTTTSNTTADDL